MLRSRGRQRQLESLRKMVPHARAVDGDDSKWDISVSTVKYGVLSFRVQLPRSFPEAPPDLRLLVQARHRWVNGYLQITGHPFMQPWKPEYSLGQLCREIIVEFTTNPPEPAEVKPPSAIRAGRMLFPSDDDAAARLGPPSPLPHSQSPSPQPASPLPASPDVERKQQLRAPSPKQRRPSFQEEVPDTFPELDACSSAELDQMLANEGAFLEFFERLPAVTKAATVRGELVDLVESLALQNLERQDALHEARAPVEPLVAEVTALQEELRELRARQDAVRRRFSAANVIDLAERACDRLDSEASLIKRQYDDGALTARDFSNQLLASRRRYHSLAARTERLKELYGRFG